MNKLTALLAIALLTSGLALFGSELKPQEFDPTSKKAEYRELHHDLLNKTTLTNDHYSLSLISGALFRLASETVDLRVKLEQLFSGLNNRFQGLEETVEKLRADVSDIKGSERTETSSQALDSHSQLKQLVD